MLLDEKNNNVADDPNNKEWLADFVKNCHQDNTTAEIAEFFNIPPHKVLEAAKLAGVICVKDVDRLKKLVTDNKDKTPKEIARMCFYTPVRIHQVAKDLGIELPRDTRKVRIANPVNASNIANTIKSIKPPSTIVRVKDVYTQSGSPYGIANELNGIKTK